MKNRIFVPMSTENTNLLNNINLPADLKGLTKKELVQVSNELRQYIINHCAVHGGHFAASLGVVELTVALHHVFDTPNDELVWDVGHQAYGHKILTGRKAQFHTNRTYKGISGFPKMSESEYDSFGVGHSSTSISAALGMAVASKYKKEKKNHIAVIGDGSMTAGMAFEALNHAGISKSNVLVILNDNCMAIDPNVGALKEYLTDITTNKYYNEIREDVWKMIGKIGGTHAQRTAAKMEAGLKSVLSKSSNLFESLSFRYFGPIDGHDVEHLSTVLNDLKDIDGPKLLHIVTKKGKGYAAAEKDQTKWHAPGLFNPNTGEIILSKSEGPQPPKYQDVFGHTMIELAEKNEKIMGITPAMPSGCSLKYMMEKMPDRAFDVGIAEQHAVTFSAGLATQGLVPFCNIYSSFMQRAYDQVIHDVALQKLHVIFCLDRGGLVGDDGATHHGTFDYAFMRCVPNMTVMAPMNEEELRNMMYSAQLKKNAGAISIRYPRGNGVLKDWQRPLQEIKFGTGRTLKEGKDLAILTIGHVGNFASEAIKELGNEIDAAHYDMRFVKPIDTKLLDEIFAKHDHVITIENGCIQGGFGSAVIEYMVEKGYHAKVKRLGVPDEFIEHGKPHQLYAECGFDKDGIVHSMKEMIIEKRKTIV